MRPLALILVAIEMEFRAVVRICGPDFYKRLRFDERGPIHAPAKNAFKNWDIEIHRIGMSARRLEAIAVPSDCKLIVMAGLGGALDPKLSIGDVVISGAPSWLPIPDAIISAPVVTTEHAVTSVAAKAELFARTKAAIVDMETSIVRAWAAKSGVDFMSVRAISDAASDEFDPRILKLVDNDGRARPTHIGSYLLGNPLRIASLMRLGKNSKRAATNLGQAVRTIIERLPPALG